MSASSGIEKRQFGRRRTSAHGWVRVPGRPPIACIVRNVSDGGALVELEDARSLPYQFRLVVPSLGIDRDCEPRHLRANQLGVEFRQVEVAVHPAADGHTADARAWTSQSGNEIVRRFRG